MVREIQPQLFRPERRAINHAQERSEQMQLVGEFWDAAPIRLITEEFLESMW